VCVCLTCTLWTCSVCVPYLYSLDLQCVCVPYLYSLDLQCVCALPVLFGPAVCVCHVDGNILYLIITRSDGQPSSFTIIHPMSSLTIPSSSLSSHPSRLPWVNQTRRPWGRIGLRTESRLFFVESGSTSSNCKQRLPAVCLYDGLFLSHVYIRYMSTDTSSKQCSTRGYKQKRVAMTTFFANTETSKFGVNPALGILHVSGLNAAFKFVLQFCCTFSKCMQDVLLLLCSF